MRDKEIRRVLLHNLHTRYRDDADTLIVEEFGLCQGNARVDIAVINGAICGYEIKSEKDTLRRLSGQEIIYSKVFDYVTIVASTHHLQNIRKQIPAWWGLHEAQCVNKGIRLVKRRTCKKNRAVNSYALAQLLWRDEAFEILKRRNIHQGLAGKARRLMWARLVESLTFEELSSETRAKIKTRQHWRSGMKQVLNDD